MLEGRVRRLQHRKIAGRDVMSAGEWGLRECGRASGLPRMMKDRMRRKIRPATTVTGIEI